MRASEQTMQRRIARLARLARLALLVSAGVGVTDAGQAMGLTRGETARCWARIKQDLGWQAQ